jgi:hypothetical protein
MLIVLDDSFSTIETCKGDGSFLHGGASLIIKTFSVSPGAFARIFGIKNLLHPGFSVTLASTS